MGESTMAWWESGGCGLMWCVGSKAVLSHPQGLPYHVVLSILVLTPTDWLTHPLLRAADISYLSRTLVLVSVNRSDQWNRFARTSTWPWNEIVYLKWICLFLEGVYWGLKHRLAELWGSRTDTLCYCYEESDQNGSHTSKSCWITSFVDQHRSHSTSRW